MVSNLTSTGINNYKIMDKETLKTLLKEHLKVETDIYWKRIITRILFDDEIISEDYIERDSL